MQEGYEEATEGGKRRGGEGTIAGSVAQDGERGGSGTNSSRRMRDNAAHPRSLICIHPVSVSRGNHYFLHLPSTSSIFNGRSSINRDRAAM